MKYIKIIFIFLIGIAFLSCKSKNLNYIDYYHKVYAIDSMQRVDKDTLATIRQYKKLFRKYPPSQNERMEEYEVYIRYADKFHKKFGGIKSLDKLIAQSAPNWKYKREDQDFFKLYEKYGIDSIGVERKVLQWKKSLNKVLIDSFSIASARDQYNARVGPTVVKDDKKNAELLIWTFKNYGFPSRQKIGLSGNNDQFMSMGTLLNHMAGTEYYEYFKTKLLEYVRSGECTPRDYIEMVDKYQYIHHLEPIYGIYSHYDKNFNAEDSVRIDRNRQAIGFPTFKQSSKITKDFQRKMNNH
ncbi:hypothetical protein EG346_01035 [Chryseobacterium carnipullorum]|uniref:Uncharacterized protein n=1 Tax=Chryseobacterium carnipullorum TaxID=1124835 RepID=A0A1M7G684_CHRCU|nr:hypothetical protein [Chryseobacterium carnipullorum]MDN5476198.1 hypothetical protein [Chryseobacterium sp.]AZA46887.1 hypothetical protein EG346_01035 [Chryseobacterium carnipullorum]AZA66246.1 hypothetical protein EG345_17120 [Chryseobacterium carnipullorum]SHM11655.1 hypothetical protein SAMN05444360_10818 [Chryseobacterium carnipullorum]STD06566.1 Uncharacterised protein [Chryseobacterium carnipullorum]